MNTENLRKLITALKTDPSKLTLSFYGAVDTHSKPLYFTEPWEKINKCGLISYAVRIAPDKLNHGNISLFANWLDLNYQFVEVLVKPGPNANLPWVPYPWEQAVKLGLIPTRDAKPYYLPENMIHVLTGLLNGVIVQPPMIHKGSWSLNPPTTSFQYLLENTKYQKP